MSAIRRAEATWSPHSPPVRAPCPRLVRLILRPAGDMGRPDRVVGRPDGPEELVAAAHAACFAMALSGALARAGTPPERLDVSAEVTFDKLEAGWRVVSSALTVRGVVPGMSVADFEAAAKSTKDGCPISVALTGNVALSVDATLVG